LILHDPVAPSHQVVMTVPTNPSAAYTAWSLADPAGTFPTLSWVAPVPPVNGAQGGFIYSGPTTGATLWSTATELLPTWLVSNQVGPNNNGGVAGTWDYATPAQLNLAMVGAVLGNNQNVITNGLGQLVTQANGGANTVLHGTTPPSYSAVNLASADVTGVLPVANGGTNSSAALANGKVMISSGGAIIEGANVTSDGSTLNNTGAANIASAASVAASFGNGGNTHTISIGNNAAGAGISTTTIGQATAPAGAIVNVGGGTGGSTVNLGGTVNVLNLANGVVHTTGGGGTLAASNVVLTSEVTGVLPVANGGTNSSTALNNNRIMVSNGGAIVEAAALTNGQLLIGSSAAAPVAGTLTATLNQTTVTNGAGTITIGTVQNINTTSTPTFAGETLNGNLNITAGGATVVGTTNINTSGAAATSIGSGPGTGTVSIGNATGGTTIVSPLTLTGAASAAPTSYLALNGANQVITSNASVVTGSGTGGTIPVWTPAGPTSVLTNSLLTDNGTTLAYNTNKFTVASATGNTATGGSLTVGNLSTGVVHSGVAGLLTSSAVNLTSEVTGVLPVANGGTNSSTALNNGRVMVSSGGQIVENALGGANTVLHGDLTFAAVNLTSQVSNVLPIANGGTNTSTAPTANQIVVGNAGGTAYSSLGTLGSATTVLHGNAGGLPTFGAVGLTTDVTGVLPVANGGTNSSTALANGKVMISSAGAIIEGANVTSDGSTLNNTGAANLGSGVGVAVSLGNGGGAHTINIGANTTGGTTSTTTIGQSTAPTAGTIVNVGGGTGPSNTNLGGAVFVTNLSSNGVVHTTGGTGALAVSQVNLTSEVTGVLPVANGGTNSSTALNNGRIMVSNGGAVVEGTAGTTTTVLHGNAAGQPSYSAVSLTADVSGILPAANGGTGVNSPTAKGILVGQGAAAATSLNPGGVNNIVGSTNGTDWISGLPSVFGIISGSGTANTMTKWTGAATIGDAALTDNGANLIYAGNFNVSSAGAVTGVTTLATSGNITDGGLTSGSVVFAGAAGLLSQSNANFFYNNASSRLGIGTATPATVNGSNIKGITINSDDPAATTASGLGSDGHQLTIQSAASNNEELEIGLNTSAGAGNAFGTIQAYRQGVAPLTLKIQPVGGNVFVGNGTVTLSNLGLGVVHSSGAGLLTSAAVNLASADVTGILPIANGGTNSSAAVTANSIMVGNPAGTAIISGAGISTNAAGTQVIATGTITAASGSGNDVTLGTNGASEIAATDGTINTPSNINSAGTLTTGTAGQFTVSATGAVATTSSGGLLGGISVKAANAQFNLSDAGATTVSHIQSANTNAVNTYTLPNSPIGITTVTLAGDEIANSFAGHQQITQSVSTNDFGLLVQNTKAAAVGEISTGLEVFTTAGSAGTNKGIVITSNNGTTDYIGLEIADGRLLMDGTTKAGKNVVDILTASSGGGSSINIAAGQNAMTSTVTEKGISSTTSSANNGDFAVKGIVSLSSANEVDAVSGNATAYNSAAGGSGNADGNVAGLAFTDAPAPVIAVGGATAAGAGAYSNGIVIKNGSFGVAGVQPAGKITAKTFAAAPGTNVLVNNPLCTANSYIILTPASATAATAQLYVSNTASGVFTVTNAGAGSALADADFYYFIITPVAR